LPILNFIIFIRYIKVTGIFNNVGNLIVMDNNHTLIEVCAASLSSALVAQQGGADRIELCAGLELGGLTPSFAMLEMTKEALNIPINVLIRSRGGDFCYSEAEMQVMLRDIENCKKLGVNGIVFGTLTPSGEIEMQQLQRVMKAIEGMDFTFHRAFDRCKLPFDALMQLIDMGVPRILSSGQQPSALKGVRLLAQLIEKAKNQIIIMPGAGIGAHNIIEIQEKTQAKEIHLSAKQQVKSPFLYINDLKDALDYDETALETVKKIVSLVKK
jgi:copper homeostasis protein